MLTSRPQDGKLRVARNLLPRADGAMESRPGARQLVAGAVSAVVPWGNRLLVQQAGRLLVWDGELTDVGPAGSVLDAAAFQALTGEGQRQDRLYVADGARPLYYIASTGDSYRAYTFANQVLDPTSGLPVDLPMPIAIGFWKSRLWVSTGGNQVQHCQADDPAQWNPLWTIEVQGSAMDRLVAIQPAGDLLLLGLSGSVWGLTGTSQFDFKRQPLWSYGCCGTRGVAFDGTRPWWLGPSGVRTADTAPISEPIHDWFTAGVTGGLVFDRTRNLLLACVNGRVLAVHLQAGGWGEVCPDDAAGVWASDDRVGWYGATGVWALQNRNEAWIGPEGAWYLGQETYEDIALDDQTVAVGALAETWPVAPNGGGNGRALLNRTHATLRGYPGGQCRYTAIADNLRSSEAVWDLSGPVTSWGDLNDDVSPSYDDLPPVVCEAVPRLQGSRFVHRFQGTGRLELVRTTFDYRFAAPAA